MIKHSYSKCSYGCCAYLKDTSDGNMIYLLLYMDDMLMACHEKEEIDMLKDLLSNELKMNNLKAIKRILGWI